MRFTNAPPLVILYHKNNSVVAQSTLYDAPGSNIDGAMTQLAATSMIFQDPNDRKRIQIGKGAQAMLPGAIALGNLNTTASGEASIAIGTQCVARGQASVAFAFGEATRQGEFNIGTSNAWQKGGYNNTNLRLLAGVHDGQDIHDAATVGQVNAMAGTARKLTTDDYNWPADNPTGVALWLLDSGLYSAGDGVEVYFNASLYFPNAIRYRTYLIQKTGANAIIWLFSNTILDSLRAVAHVLSVLSSTGALQVDLALNAVSVVDNLTSTSTTDALSANQGKVLDDKIAALAARIEALEG